MARSPLKENDRVPNRSMVVLAAIAALLYSGGAALPVHAATFFTGTLSDAANFALLYTANGNNQLSLNNGTVTGNIGIGDPSGTTTGFLASSGPETINGNVMYAGAVSGNQSISNTTLNGTVSGGHTNVQADITNLYNLSALVGAETGTTLTVNLTGSGQSQTVNASSGTLDANGYRVFSVSSFALNNNDTLTINGTANDLVVLNIPFNVQINGSLALSGGITSDQVLINVTGGSNFTGGHTLQMSTNGAADYATLMDMNGTITINHTTIDGRVFGGDSSNFQFVSGANITAPSTRAPEPGSVMLMLSGILGLGAYRLGPGRRSRTAN